MPVPSTACTGDRHVVGKSFSYSMALVNGAGQWRWPRAKPFMTASATAAQRVTGHLSAPSDAGPDVPLPLDVQARRVVRR
jgi:hypothetical protein